MEARKYIRVLANGWWVIILATLIVAISVVLFTAQQERVYSAATTLIITPQETLTTTNEVLSAMNALDKRSIVITYSTLLGNDVFKQKILQVAAIPEGQRRSVNILVVAVADANALRISVEANSPDTAAIVANALADQGVNELSTVYPVYALKRTDIAVASDKPIRPSQQQNLLGIPIGLAFGLALVLVCNYLGIRIPSIPPQRNPVVRTHTILSSSAQIVEHVEQELNKIPGGNRNLGVILVDLTDVGEAPQEQQAALERITMLLETSVTRKAESNPNTDSVAPMLITTDAHAE